jgi:abortive infection bacteriophage resistance protein
MNAESFNKKHKHDIFLNHINRDIKNNENQSPIEHHIAKYEGKFPVWVIIEYSTMGELSYFYSDLIKEDKKYLANKLFGTTDKNVSSWLICLTYLRNFCAHYSRLYYYKSPAIPATPKGFPYTLYKKLFDYILVLKFLYGNKDKWENSFLVNLESLIQEYQDSINLFHIGFPKNWNELLYE